MRYTPHTSADREQMLRAIGIDSIEALYQHVPATLRQHSKVNLPEGVSEFAVRQRLAGLASHNAIPPDWSLFLGGGIYHHFIPSAVDAIISRAEFATSYTPYQPEVSQGTLQALFEYQTLICQLTGMEVSNAAVYDGAVRCRGSGVDVPADSIFDAAESADLESAPSALSHGRRDLPEKFSRMWSWKRFRLLQPEQPIPKNSRGESVIRRCASCSAIPIFLA